MASIRTGDELADMIIADLERRLNASADKLEQRNADLTALRQSLAEQERIAGEAERLLREAKELLDSAQSGYIPGCGEALKWEQKRDEVMCVISASEREDAKP